MPTREDAVRTRISSVPYGSVERWLIDLKKPYAEIESGLLALRASRQIQQAESTSLKVTLTYRDGIAKLTLVQSLRRNAIGAEKSATIETLLLEFNRDFGSGTYMTHRMNNGLFVDLLGFILQVFSNADDHGPLATLASSFPKKVKTRLTYNFAHLRSTKESLTIEYFEKKFIFWAKILG